MSQPTEYVQSRIGVRMRFVMGEDRVTHSFRDRSGEREFRVPYEHIDFDDITTLALPNATPVMYLWGAGFPLGFFALRAGYDQPILGAVIGIAAFALIFIGVLAKDLKWFLVRMDLVPAATGGQLRVLHDARRDEIVAALTAAQRRVLRAKYADAVPGEDPVRARARFDWLLAKGAIDAAEHRAAVAALEELVPAERPHALN